MKKLSLPLLILLCTSNIAKADGIKNGEKQFNMNCLACHQTDKFTVGPSMVEISKKYPIGKLDYFTAWANEPGKVNKQAIQMPSMAHVGDKNLKDIHDYILATTKGKTEQKKQRNAPSEYTKPDPVYPFTARSYLPETSPASIAIAFSRTYSLVWDTAIGNLKYAFVGGPIYMNSHRLPRKMNLSYIKFSPINSHPFSFANEDNYHYVGYKLENNLPDILYEYGNISVSEKLRPGKNNKSFTRHFQITGLKNTATLDLSHTGNATITSSKGQISNKLLTINALDAQDFVIEVTIK